MSQVPALRNGLAVLRVLAERERPMAAAAIAHEVGVPLSSTYHLLAELRTAEFVEHHAVEKRWALGPGVALLGAAYKRTHSHADPTPAGEPPATTCPTAEPPGGTTIGRTS